MTTPCYICGKGMEEPRLDSRDMKTRPCSTCEEIIQETVGGRGDGSDMTWEEFVLLVFDEEDTPVDAETDLGNP